MTAEIQNPNSRSCFSCVGSPLASVKYVACKTTSVALSAMEYTANTLFNWGRGTDYTCQWVKDYFDCSSDVKAAAGRVKGVADRFNLFACFSEVVTSGRNLVRKPMESFGGAVESVLAHLGAGTEFAARLGNLKVISLGAAQPYVGGVEAIVTSTLGVKGVHDALGVAEENNSFMSSMIKVAKSVTLIVLGVLCGISACFASIAASMPQLPLYVLTAATTFLGLEIVDYFYVKLALPSPLEAVVSDV